MNFFWGGKKIDFNSICLQEHLPKEYCYKILNYVRIDENKFQFRVKFQINELDEVSSFLESYTVKNWIRYRLSKVNPTDNATVFHVSYNCCSQR